MRFDHIKVKMLADNAGISARAIARSLNVAHSTSSNWLNGTHAPQIDNLNALANLLRCTPLSMFSDVKELDEWRSRLENTQNTMGDALLSMRNQNQALQAKLDALMWEYCPRRNDQNTNRYV